MASCLADVKHQLDIYDGVRVCEPAAQPLQCEPLCRDCSPCWSCVFGDYRVSLHTVPLARHAKDLGARWRSAGWMNNCDWTAACVRVLLCDNWRIPWYKTATLRSLCSFTRDTLYFSVLVGWWGWGQKGENCRGTRVVVAAACLFYYLSRFTTLIPSGKSYVKHNRRAIRWKQWEDIRLNDYWLSEVCIHYDILSHVCPVAEFVLSKQLTSYSDC